MKLATDQESLPKTLPGVVCRQMVKCGKPNCRCARGILHQTYYRFWREQGKLKKTYVRCADLEATREACLRWKEADAMIGGILNRPAAQETKAEQRAILRSALGEQAYTEVGQRLLRRLTR
jgi:hypothetical protein